MRVVLGNRNAVESIAHPDHEDGLVRTMPKGKRATEIEIPDGTSIVDAITTILNANGVWAAHTHTVPEKRQNPETGDSETVDVSPAPAWVASDSKALAGILSEHFGGIEIRELDVNPPTRKPRGGAAAAASTALLLGVLLWTIAALQPFLKTNAGNDFQAKQMGGAASATAVAKWMALTANTTAPAAGDTSLTGEITTAGGGLVRVAGTYAHTTGAASYTISNTFTANGSDSLPVTIGKLGILDAASSGNLVFSTLVSPTATLSASGDALTLTQTVTL